MLGHIVDCKHWRVCWCSVQFFGGNVRCSNADIAQGACRLAILGWRVFDSLSLEFPGQTTKTCHVVLGSNGFRSDSSQPAIRELCNRVLFAQGVYGREYVYYWTQSICTAGVTQSPRLLCPGSPQKGQSCCETKKTRARICPPG